METIQIPAARSNILSHNSMTSTTQVTSEQTYIHYILSEASGSWVYGGSCHEQCSFQFVRRGDHSRKEGDQIKLVKNQSV